MFSLSTVGDTGSTNKFTKKGNMMGDIMKKVSVLRKIADSGVVAIVRTESKEEAIKVFDALIQGE